MDGVKESTFYFLLPRWLERFPVSNLLDIVFLFFNEVRGMSFIVDEMGGRVWSIASSLEWVTSSLTMPFPLLSFMVVISIKKKSLESRRIN